jgi:phosphate transport system substrate-binding protein
MKRFLVTLLTLVVLAGGVVAAQPRATITGAGASFPFPLYTLWFAEYNKLTGVEVNYQSIGSGGGIRQVTERTVEFGGTDAILNAEQKQKVAPNYLLHIPTAIGGAVATYNLPELRGGEVLRFTPDLLVDIFLGKIRAWNDARIRAVNPGVNLPDRPIVIVHRSDGSGTTFIWTDYLSKVSEEWRTRVGRGTSVNWPTGLGGRGNEGVTAIVRQTPGAIGYVEFIYAKTNNLPAGLVRNKSGNFVGATLEAMALAANLPNLPADMEVMVTDTDHPNGYPLTAFTWLLVYRDQSYGARTREQAQRLVDLLWWMIGPAQSFNARLEYARIEGAALEKTRALLNQITFELQPLRPSRNF